MEVTLTDGILTEKEDVLTVEEVSDLTVAEVVDLISDDFPAEPSEPASSADESIEAASDAESGAEEASSCEVPAGQTGNDVPVAGISTENAETEESAECTETTESAESEIMTAPDSPAENTVQDTEAYDCSAENTDAGSDAPAENTETENQTSDSSMENTAAENSASDSMAEKAEAENMTSDTPAEMAEAENPASGEPAEMAEAENQASGEPAEMAEAENQASDEPAEMAEVSDEPAEKAEGAASDEPAKIAEAENVVSEASAENTEAEAITSGAPAENTESEASASEIAAEDTVTEEASSDSYESNPADDPVTDDDVYSTETVFEDVPGEDYPILTEDDESAAVPGTDEPARESAQTDVPAGKSAQADEPAGKSAQADVPAGKSAQTDGPAGKSAQADEPAGAYGRSLEEYLAEIDKGYEERKAARQARLRAKRRKRRIRTAILTVLLILLLAGGGSIAYIKNEDQLSFRLPDPLETVVHKLDPVLDGTLVNTIKGNTDDTDSTEAASVEETSQAVENTSVAESESATEAVTEAATEAETEAVGSLKQGSVLDPEVASFFTGNDMDESNADIIPTVDPSEDGATLSDEGIVSSGALLLDLDTGEVVAERNADVVISPASMTKILTVLVAAEHLTESQLDDMAAMDMETSDYVYTTNCSTADLELDEPVTVRDLFYGTILPSGGDAAMTLAKYVAGSNEAFIDMMNEKVDELGLSDTAHFTNCIGIYNEDLHCTLKDMALILRAAVQNDFCREVLSTHKYTTSPTDTYPDGVELSNWFLRRIEDYDTNGEVRCAKTGFVNESGCCAASYMLSDSGKHYICVTCHSTSSWQCIYDQIFIYSNYAK